METIKCYRFVKDDLTSENGKMSWKIGEWNKISGKIACCSNGLHAALTPRDSLRSVYGQRWFVSEARGEIVKQYNKFAASEMRIVQEIPKIVLQRFAVWCAMDCLEYYEKKYSDDKRVRDCIKAAEDYLDGKNKTDELIKKREAATAAIAAAKSGSPGRAVTAAIAANFAAATNSAAWANGALASAYAAHTTAAAISAAIAGQDALASSHNVATISDAAVLAANAAALARTAAAAGAASHAALVCASNNVAPVDSVSDAYFSSYAAFSAYTADAFSTAQDKKLLEIIDQHL